MTGRPDGPAGDDLVDVRFTKWDSRRHWTFGAVVIGEDQFGVWALRPAGTPMSRPGMDVVAETDAFLLFPRADGYVALLCEDTAPDAIRTYVDVSTSPRWSRLAAGRWAVTMADLDLDVVEVTDGTVFVDDEDEFAEHRVSMGYPPELVASALATCSFVEEAVRLRRGPFADGTRRRLAARLAASRRRSGAG